MERPKRSRIKSLRKLKGLIDFTHKNNYDFRVTPQTFGVNARGWLDAES